MPDHLRYSREHHYSVLRAASVETCSGISERELALEPFSFQKLIPVGQLNPGIVVLSGECKDVSCITTGGTFGRDGTRRIILYM